jgi:hypothetical protein
MSRGVLPQLWDANHDSKAKRTRTFGVIVQYMGRPHYSRTLPFFYAVHGDDCTDPKILWEWLKLRFAKAIAEQTRDAKAIEEKIKNIVDTKSPKAAFEAVNYFEVQRQRLGAKRLAEPILTEALLCAVERGRSMDHLSNEIGYLRRSFTHPSEHIEQEEGQATSAAHPHHGRGMVDQGAPSFLDTSTKAPRTTGYPRYSVRTAIPEAAARRSPRPPAPQGAHPVKSPRQRPLGTQGAGEVKPKPLRQRPLGTSAATPRNQVRTTRSRCLQCCLACI